MCIANRFSLHPPGERLIINLLTRRNKWLSFSRSSPVRGNRLSGIAAPLTNSECRRVIYRLGDNWRRMANARIQRAFRYHVGTRRAQRAVAVVVPWLHNRTLRRRKSICRTVTPIMLTSGLSCVHCTAPARVASHKSRILITGCVHLDNSRRRSGNRLGYVGRIKISPLDEYISVYPLYYVSTCFKRDNLSVRWKPYGRNFHLNINRIRAALRPVSTRLGAAWLTYGGHCIVNHSSALFKIAEVVYMKPVEESRIRSPIMTTWRCNGW